MSAKLQIDYQKVVLKYEIIMQYNDMIESNYQQAGYFKSKEPFVEDLEIVRKYIDGLETITNVVQMHLKTKLKKFDELSELSK